MISDSKNNCQQCSICRTFSDSRIYILNGDEINNFKFDLLNCYIVFVLSGSVVNYSTTAKGRKVDANNLFLMLGDKSTALISHDSYTKLLVCSFHPEHSDCYRSFLFDIREGAESDDVAFAQETLEIHELLWKHIEAIIPAISDYEWCDYWYLIKIEELLIYMRKLYSLEQLQLIFSPIVGTAGNFRSCVFRYYNKVNSLEEFANLANMSTVTFNRKFKKYFGVSTSVWLKERKKEQVLRELKLSSKSISEISFELGFSSPSYFTLFCRKNFGATPGQLRKTLIYQNKIE